MSPGPHLEAKKDLSDGIYIYFHSDGSLFNVCHLSSQTKTMVELITELFADNCALLDHTEAAQQHIINVSSM